jgi:lysophospholipase L1-like esterase
MTTTLPAALILGDSQTWGIGTALAKALRQTGWTVTLERHSGWSTRKLYALAAKMPDARRYSRVYIQTGGNDYQPDPAALIALVRLFRPGTVSVVSLPPATRIGNLATARKAFGPHIQTSDHWFRGKFAAGREAKNRVYQKAVSGIATYIDVRRLGVPGHVQPTGVVFPNQPDGIHVSGATAQRIASEVAVYSPPYTRKFLLLAGGVGLVAGALGVWWALSRASRQK